MGYYGGDVLKTEEFCDKFYQNLASTAPTYVWGANLQIATKELMDKLYKSYGSAKYPKESILDRQKLSLLDFIS